MASFLKALHEKTKEDNLESLDSDPRGLPLNSIGDSVNSALQSTSRFGQDVSGTLDSIKGTSFGGIGSSLKGKLEQGINAAEDQAKAAALTGLKFGTSSIAKGIGLDKIKETLPAANSNTARILENNLKDISSKGMDLLKNSLEDSLKDSFDHIADDTGLQKITDQMKQIGLPGIKDPKSLLQDKLPGIKDTKSLFQDKVAGLPGVKDTKSFFQDQVAGLPGIKDSKAFLQNSVAGLPGIKDANGFLQDQAAGLPGIKDAKGFLQDQVAGLPGIKDANSFLKDQVAGLPGIKDSKAFLQNQVGGLPGIKDANGFLQDQAAGLPGIKDAKGFLQDQVAGLPGIKNANSFLKDQADNIQKEKDKILSSKFSIGSALPNAVNNSINSLNMNVSAAASKGISDITNNFKGSSFSGLQEKDIQNKMDAISTSVEGTIKQGALQGMSMLGGQLGRIQQAAEGDIENLQKNSKFNLNTGILQIPLDDQMKAAAERMPDEDGARRSSSGNPFLVGGSQIPFGNQSLEKNVMNNISAVSKMKASQLQKELPKMDGFGSQINEMSQVGQLQKQQINQLESQMQARALQIQPNQQLHQQFLPPNQLQLSAYSASQQQQVVGGYVQQNMNNNINIPGQQQLQFNPQRLNQALKAESNSSKNAPPEIQPLILPEVQQLISDQLLKMLPWVLLSIIGLWTLVFMIAQLAYFSSFSIFKQNSQEEVAAWYSTNVDLQQAALDINNGLAYNTITFLDFLIYFVVTKVVYAIWLSEDYLGSGVCKDFLVMLFLLKDIAVIVLSLTAGSYDDSASGWSNFGFYWLSSIGKLSIIISIQKILFFRLNYFRLFSQQKSGCTGGLRDWSVSLYNWATVKQEQFPELVIICIFAGILYLPLIFHMIVGVIQFTFIVIIWVSMLFLLQQVFSFVFEICKPRQQDQTLSERLMENQSQGISQQLEKYWAFFLPLIVLAPSISSASFSDSFEQSMKIYLSGSQLILNYFAIPSGNSSYANTMSFLCNLLSMF